METIARLITVLAVAASSACGAASSSPSAPPAVVALTRASQDDASSELAAGLALEAAHWLVNRNDVIVRVVDDFSAYSKASFTAVNERLAIDMVVWVDVSGTAAAPVVSYRLETSTGEAGGAKVLAQHSGGLPAIPGRIARDVQSALRLPTMGAQLPAWTLPAAPAYDAYLHALGRTHTKARTEAERVALFDTVAPAMEAYPPALTELGGAYLDLAGKSSGNAPYYDRSEEILRRAVQLDALYPPARQKLASHFAKRGRSEESLKLLQDGLVTHPHFPGNHADRGYLLRYAGLMEASMESYRRAQELDRSLEHLVATQDQITKSLIYLGNYREAMASHDRMESFVARLGRTPDEKEWFYRGVIHLYAGDRDNALDAFQRGEALDATSVWTTFGRAYAGMARGDRDGVAKVLDALEEHVVVDGERHYRLVHFASFLGQSERALHHLETSIRGGFFNAPYIASDPLTAGIRTEPGFADRLGEAQKRHASFKSAAGDY
jgi:tetratricopeptide (TPR) repeat protein